MKLDILDPSEWWKNKISRAEYVEKKNWSGEIHDPVLIYCSKEKRWRVFSIKKLLLITYWIKNKKKKEKLLQLKLRKFSQTEVSKSIKIYPRSDWTEKENRMIVVVISLEKSELCNAQYLVQHRERGVNISGVNKRVGCNFFNNF